MTFKNNEENNNNPVMIFSITIINSSMNLKL